MLETLRIAKLVKQIDLSELLYNLSVNINKKTFQDYLSDVNDIDDIHEQLNKYINRYLNALCVTFIENYKIDDPDKIKDINIINELILYLLVKEDERPIFRYVSPIMNFRYILPIIYNYFSECYISERMNFASSPITDTHDAEWDAEKALKQYSKLLIDENMIDLKNILDKQAYLKFQYISKDFSRNIANGNWIFDYKNNEKKEKYTALIIDDAPGKMKEQIKIIEACCGKNIIFYVLKEDQYKVIRASISDNKKMNNMFVVQDNNFKNRFGAELKVNGGFPKYMYSDELIQELLIAEVIQHDDFDYYFWYFDKKILKKEQLEERLDKCPLISSNSDKYDAVLNAWGKPDDENNAVSSNKIFISDFDYIFIDLLLDDSNSGQELIRKFLQYRAKKFNDKKGFDIIALSRSKKTDDIQRTLNEGAVCYITKDRMFSIPHRLKSLGGFDPTISSTYQNFRSLYRLPPKFRRELHRSKLKPWNSIFEEKRVERWIRKMPKADLHCHIGGSMETEILAPLALASLCKIIKNYNNANKDNEKPEEKTWFDKNKNLIKVIAAIVYRYYKLKEETISIVVPGIEVIKKTKEEPAIIEIRIGKVNNKIKIKDIPEKAIFPKLAQWFNKDAEDEIIFLFNIIMGIRSGDIEPWGMYNSNDNGWNDAFKALAIKSKLNGNISSMKKNFKAIVKIVKEQVGKAAFESIKKDLVKDIILASENKADDLLTYLRGNGFTGSEFLKNKENIYIVCLELLKAAAKENVRYLEFRCSPYGYVNDKMNFIEAIDTLLDGFDWARKWIEDNGEKSKTCKPPRVNVIFTGKRHKSISEISRHVSALIVYLSSLKNRANKYPTKDGYMTKVVGFDLAGDELNYGSELFKNDLLPLFRICSFITVHEGEQTSAEKIWEAIYKLHANRIGHGLSIQQHSDLLEMVKERNICIELCPKSNWITNKNIRGGFKKYGDDKGEREYPLYKLFKAGVQVCINTDNWAISPSTITEDYIYALELSAYEEGSKNIFSKWDVLRLIKMGFKNAFLNKEDKQKFMREIDEEIFDAVLEEENWDILSE
ncbi:hypothetical protein ACFL2A_06485 [Thermodesulfobacteriota bacterium]